MAEQPWAGQLSCDLRNDTLAVSTDAMVVIDSNGVAWATVLPNAGGFYDHSAFIVKAVNSHGALVKALTALCDEIGETEIHGDGAFDQDCSVCKAHKRARKLIKSLADVSAAKVTGE